ncbi:MAG TPA: hypothetical protein VIM01_14975, partial [Dermatophilaceae bacterium]
MARPHDGHSPVPPTRVLVCFHAHPDHVRVHVVGVRAAELAGVTHVYEATVNRDHMVRLMASNPQWAAEA